MSSDAFKRHFEKASAEYLRRLPHKLTELERLWEDVTTGAGSASSLLSLQRELHTLAGTAQTMGAPAVTDAARAAESFLEPFVAGGTVPPAAEHTAFGQLLAALTRSAQPLPGMGPELKKVLLVEDNGDIRTIVKMALEKVGGLTVRACESGTEALAALAEFGPQLVLLDVMMPEMDGPTVLKRLRESPDTAGIEVVFLTAKTTAQEIQMLRGLGALGVIPKPFDPLTLHEAVRRIWDGAKG